jgi:putative SOS response-associated peptidase YedK
MFSSVETFFETDWRSGKAMPTGITLPNGEPMGLAGLWAKWRSPEDATVHSFTMLTMNADAHPFMRNFHNPQDEKRMIAIVPPERYDDWLQAGAGESEEFLRAWPAAWMAAQAQDKGIFRSPARYFFDQTYLC